MINDGKHIQNIIHDIPCTRHGSIRGEACFDVVEDKSGTRKGAICNHRAIQAGYNGEISDAALRKNPPAQKKSAWSR